ALPIKAKSVLRNEVLSLLLQALRQFFRLLQKQSELVGVFGAGKNRILIDSGIGGGVEQNHRAIAQNRFESRGGGAGKNDVHFWQQLQKIVLSIQDTRR